MKAVVCGRYGPPESLRFTEVEKPVPQHGEVLIKVMAASINAADWHVMRGEPFIGRPMMGTWQGPKYPILGSDIAGEVEAVGEGVTQLKAGDAVFGAMSAHHWSGFAEYVCATEDAVVLKPAGVSFEDAAAAPIAAITALQALRDTGHVQAGQQVLINGASGGVGTFAAQIAKSYGAEVTAVCSTRNIEMVRGLGADHVIDYTQEDFTQSSQRYDLIVAVNGYHPIWDYRRALRPGGVYVMAGGANAQMFQALLLGPALSGSEGKRLGSVSAKANKPDLLAVGQLLEAGKIKPVIDRSFPLSQIVEAFQYFEGEHARGKVILVP